MITTLLIALSLTSTEPEGLAFSTTPDRASAVVGLAGSALPIGLGVAAALNSPEDHSVMVPGLGLPKTWFLVESAALSGVLTALTARLLGQGAAEDPSTSGLTRAGFILAMAGSAWLSATPLSIGITALHGDGDAVYQGSVIAATVVMAAGLGLLSAGNLSHALTAQAAPPSKPKVEPFISIVPSAQGAQAMAGIGGHF